MGCFKLWWCLAKHFVLRFLILVHCGIIPIQSQAALSQQN